MFTSRRRPFGWCDGLWAAPLLAAILTLALHVVVLVRQRTFPFGPVSRGLGDYGAQYLPFHQALAQALHGSDLVSPRFSWLAGAGVSPIPDYATYLASPFNLVLAVVPLDHVELALAWIVLAKVAVAAAVMTVFLRALAPRSHALPAILLGVAYACSTWVFDIAIYTPQWLDGLIGLPLLCLVALWCRRQERSGRRTVAGTLLVALVWWSNYYTAYMASLGAALVLVLVLAATASCARAAAGAVLRFAVTGVLGVTLTAPILLPTLLAVRRSTPYEGAGLPVLPPRALLARLLPFTEGIAATPSLAAGSVALVLAASLPLARHVPVRQRLVFTIGTGLTILSLLAGPAIVVWNAFDTPNGNPYRYSFVLVGLMVVCAYLALQDGGLGPDARFAWPTVPATVVGAVVVASLAASAAEVHIRRLYLTELAWRWPLAMALAVVVCSLLRGRLRKVATVALVAAAAVEVPLNAGVVDDGLRTYLQASPVQETVAAVQLRESEAATAQARWPRGRVGVSPWEGSRHYLSYNTGMRLGYPAVSYYSSTLPLDLASALVSLGAGARASGRMIVDTPDPVMDAVLAVSVRSSSPTAGRPQSVEAFPLVRPIGDAMSDEASVHPVFRARDALVDGRLYRAAQTSSGGHRGLPAVTLAPGAGQAVRVSCPARTRVQLLTGGGDVAVRWTSQDGIHGESRMPLASVLTLPALAGATVELRNVGTHPARLPADGVACLDEEVLHRQIEQTSSPRIEVHPGTVDAVFDAPAPGVVVVATVAQEGWSCAVDRRPAEITPRSGLLAVAMGGGRSLSCGYTTPGTTAGLLVGTAALMVTLGWGLVMRRRRRTGA